MDYAMIGPALVLGLACIGSAIGCGIGGMACHGIMSRVEDNHGKFIVMSALPSSQSVFGFVLMIFMKDKILEGHLSQMSAIGIGLSVGLALLFSSLYQGMCAASGMQASAKEPRIIGKCFVALGIIESFSIFAFVFAFLLM
ncbi:MAG: ATP synthase subunit C [Rhabdochlamydiaceae bacterium]